MTQKHALMTATILAAGLLAAPAMAERILRVDEAPIGEMDPAKGTDYADTVLAINLYDTLVYPRQGGSGVQPHLASDWTIDGPVYTFTLRDDVTFNSGNPLTAADVVFSFERMMALGQGNSGLFEGRVESAVAMDDTTVQFTLTEPFAPFLATLVRLPIVDMVTVMANIGDGNFGEFGDYASEWMSQNSAGSGPYVAMTHDPQTETVLVYEPDYFLEPAENYPERVRYRYGLDASTVRALIARGEHDISSQWLPPEVFAALANEGVANLVTEAGLTGEYFKLNTRRPPLDDVHCRRAMAYAFDYNTLLQLVRINEETTQGRPMSSALPQGLVGFEGGLPDFDQDMARAQEELALCAYEPDEHPIEIAWIAETPARERGALMMQALYSQMGFDVSITRTPWALVTEQVTDPDTAPHVIEIAVSALSPDTDSLLFNMYHSSMPPTWMSASYMSNAELDGLLEEGRTETDPDRRQEIYAAANEILREEVPDIYGYELLGAFAVRSGVSFHNLEDPSLTYPVSGFNLRFADVSVPPSE
ncbi:MAG: ABC transporter substrate-binding protein [Alphaproteobacteria bacterium]|nr:ABC transporter substrate-binding protein [Alphaproteobacteria bacterium]